MKKILATIVMLMLLIGSLSLGMKLAIKMDIRAHERQSYMRMMERIDKLHAKPEFVYDCTVKEPSVPFFFSYFFSFYYIE